MQRLWLVSLLLIVLTTACSRPESRAGNPASGEVPTPGGVVIEGAMVFTGTVAPPVQATLVIRDGTIESIWPGAERPADARLDDARVIDARGMFALPGLIDAHVHLTRGQGAGEIEAALAIAARRGVTTVRDMAGHAPTLSALAARAESGQLVSPRIRLAGLIAGPGFFSDPRVAAVSSPHEPGRAPWARAIADPEHAEDLVNAAKAVGAHGIKLYADLSTRTTAAVTAAAKAQGLPVWTHAAVFPAGPAELVAAGVTCLSHAALLAFAGSEQMPRSYRESRPALAGPLPPVDAPAIDAVLEAMARNGVLLEPTLAVTEKRGPEAPLVAWTYAVTRRAREAGVELVAGSDGMIGANGEPAIFRELELLVEHGGLSPIEAIAAATVNAARALQLADTGTIAAGKRADIVVVRDDPRVDIGHLRRPWLVVSGGRVIVEAGR